MIIKRNRESNVSFIFNQIEWSHPMAAKFGEVVVDNIIIGRERRLRD